MRSVRWDLTTAPLPMIRAIRPLFFVFFVRASIVAQHEPHKKQRFDDDIDNQPEEEKKLSMGSPVYGPDDDYSSDSDGGMTPAESRRYQRQVHDSQGFEVDYFPENMCFGLIVPLSTFHKVPSIVDDVNRVSQLAIHKYNTDNNTKYEFVKVIKVNTQIVCGSVYFVTFEAKDSPAAADDGGQVETHIFQTRAYVPIEEEIEVELVRLKPIS